MSKYMRLSLVLLAFVLLTSCASSPLQAPCDENATFCGNKTKINQW